MNANQMERAAYIAAYRILTTDLTAPELACPGARRSAIVDNIAAIIKSVYEAHDQRLDDAADWRSANSAPVRVMPRSHGRLPLRAKARETAAPAAGNLH